MLGEIVPEPTVSGSALITAYNELQEHARDRDELITRVLWSLRPCQIAELRRQWLRRARERSPATAKLYPLAVFFERRMKILRSAMPAWLDDGTADGALAVVLVFGSMKVPAVRTIYRAIEQD